MVGVKPLACAALVKAYGGVRAVDALDLDVESGRIVGLVGPNGSGKTTTLRICAGLVRPDSGRVLVNGLEQGTPAARARVAYVPDEPTGLDELTVEEYLALYRALYGAAPAFEARARALLDGFRLAERGRVPLGALSHGMRRAVTMAAAFALAPALVVVDEASAALDPEAVVVLREALAAVAAGGAGVLVATQDLHFAETACQEVVLLAAGRAVARGPVAALLRRHRAASLEGVFLAALGEESRVEELRAALRAL